MSNVGKILYGYCNGYFGEDDFDTKVIVFETECSICCRYVDNKMYRRKGWMETANFDNPIEKQDYIDKWSICEDE